MKLIYLLLFLPAFGMAACKAKKEEQGAPAGGQEQVYYTCSMHPQIKESQPGKCPICGMRLIEVKKTIDGHSDDIVLTAEQIHLGNITTDSVTTTDIADKIYLTATLDFNQRTTTAVSTRVMGRIDKLYFKNTGDYVRQGDKLFDIYSEDLNNVKQEYNLALQQQSRVKDPSVDYAQLLQSAKNKLVLWGMTEAQIRELAAPGRAQPLTTFYRPVAG